jgi:soluble lytic murein transglycosylase-like protein
VPNIFKQIRISRPRSVFAAALLLVLSPLAHAAELVTLKNGQVFDNCRRHVADGDKFRLFFGPSEDSDYLDVSAASVVSVEIVPDPPVAAPVAAAALHVAETLNPTIAEIHQLLTSAGAAHHIDVDLLASLVHAESAGNARAVSRTGARGLMQLMPGTAAELGVKDAFVPTQNVEGGTKYLDELLTRYHDNIAFALAAYNAGPGAVDRYHGVPPFRETRAYVSRIIREFNARKSTLVASK